jgi:hypothetical protein
MSYHWRVTSMYLFRFCLHIFYLSPESFRLHVFCCWHIKVSYLLMNCVYSYLSYGSFLHKKACCPPSSCEISYMLVIKVPCNCLTSTSFSCISFCFFNGKLYKLPETKRHFNILSNYVMLSVYSTKQPLNVSHMS